MIKAYLFFFLSMTLAWAFGWVHARMKNATERIRLAGTGNNPLYQKNLIIEHPWPKKRWMFVAFWEVIHSMLLLGVPFVFCGLSLDLLWAVSVSYTAWLTCSLAGFAFAAERVDIIDLPVDRWYQRWVIGLHDWSSGLGYMMPIALATANAVIFFITTAIIQQFF